MGNVLIGDNSRALLLVPRCGSHSLAAAWLEQLEPDGYAAWQASGGLHPSKFLSRQASDWMSLDGIELGVVLRGPVERFRSACGKHSLDIEQQLAEPRYRQVPCLPYAQVWRMEEGGVDAAAEWLGLTTPIPMLDAAPEKPEVTPEQADRIRALLADECEMYDTRRHRPGLGDMVKSTLSAIGITEERVSKAIGRPCGCGKRAEKLNELGRKFGIG